MHAETNRVSIFAQESRERAHYKIVLMEAGVEQKVLKYHY